MSDTGGVRILLASDVHYRLASLDWICSVASQYDAVVLAGDLLDVISPVPLNAQIVVVNTYLQRLGELTTVFVVSGNHDLDGPGDQGEQACGWLARSRTATIHVDGDSLDLAGIRVTLCPWWDGPLTRLSVDRQLRVAAEDKPQSWIWVYHAPPAGTPLCFDGRRTFADEDLARWIGEFEPDMVLCGHIHQAPWATEGSWYGRLGPTWVFNAGHVRSRIPPHIVIDTEKSTAEWFGTIDDEGGLLDLGTGAFTPIG